MQEIIDSIRLNNTKRIKKYLKNNTPPSYLIEYVIYYLQGDCEEMIKLFFKYSKVELGPIIRERNIKTLLHDAVQFTNLKIIKIITSAMLKSGTDIDSLSYDPTNTPRGSDQITPNKTPLFIAIETRQKEVVEYLLICGADPDQKCGDDITPRSIGMNDKYIRNVFSVPPRSCSKPSFFNYEV